MHCYCSFFRRRANNFIAYVQFWKGNKPWVYRGMESPRVPFRLSLTESTHLEHMAMILKQIYGTQLRVSVNREELIARSIPVSTELKF